MWRWRTTVARTVTVDNELDQLVVDRMQTTGETYSAIVGCALHGLVAAKKPGTPQSAGKGGRTGGDGHPCG